MPMNRKMYTLRDIKNLIAREEGIPAESVMPYAELLMDIGFGGHPDVVEDDNYVLQADIANEIDFATKPPKQKTEAKQKLFLPPTVQEVSAYCLDRKSGIDPEKFHAYYESNGWRVGKNPMRSWKAAVVTWERGDNGRGFKGGVSKFGPQPITRDILGQQYASITGGAK